MAARKVTTSSKSPLDVAVGQLAEIRKERARLRNEFAGVFEILDELEAAEATVTSQLKTLAREKAVEGKTVTVFSSPDLHVSVQSRYAPKEYSLDSARDEWAPEVLAAVVETRIDSKKVEGLLEAGVLFEEVAAKAMLPRSLATPAVTIKFGGK